LVRNRFGRFLTEHLHPLVHPGIPHGLMFMNGHDLFCRLIYPATMEQMGPELLDRSSIKVSEPTEDSVGISMTATAKRQLEALDPETRAKVEEAIQEIARRER